jgi:hypothetical protein
VVERKKGLESKLPFVRKFFIQVGDANYKGEKPTPLGHIYRHTYRQPKQMLIVIWIEELLEHSP